MIAIPPRNSRSAGTFVMKQMLINYLERHQHPGNRLLHIIGLPVTFVVPVVLVIQHEWMWALVSFLVGYALQFLGHAIEGNDAGEMILVKKLLGKPYVAVVPRNRPAESPKK